MLLRGRESIQIKFNSNNENITPLFKISFLQRTGITSTHSEGKAYQILGGASGKEPACQCRRH